MKLNATSVTFQVMIIIYQEEKKDSLDEKFFVDFQGYLNLNLIFFQAFKHFIRNRVLLIMNCMSVQSVIIIIILIEYHYNYLSEKIISNICIVPIELKMLFYFQFPFH